MNIANLAVSITAVDSTSKVLSGIARGFKKTTDEVEKLWKAGNKLGATMKGLGKLGTYSGMAFGGIAAKGGAGSVARTAKIGTDCWQGC